jgi:peptidoglycan hydrolase CwlO-like protein
MGFTEKDIKELNSDADRLGRDIDNMLKDIAVRQKGLKKAGVKEVPKFEKDVLDIQKEFEKLEKQIGKIDPMFKEAEFDKAVKGLQILEKDFKAACKDVDKEIAEEEKEMGVKS